MNDEEFTKADVVSACLMLVATILFFVGMFLWELWVMATAATLGAVGAILAVWSARRAMREE